MNLSTRIQLIVKKDIAVVVGFYLVAALALLGMVFQLIRGFDGMETAWAISTAMEILSLALSVVVYYGFLYNKETGTNVRFVFASLIITCSLCLFFDEIAWLVQGVPEFAVINRISNSLLYVNSFTMELMFWGYIVHAFNIKSKAAEVLNRILVVLWFPMVISSLLNIFFPIYFVVDSTGTYQRAPLYPVHLLYFLIAMPVVCVYIVRAKINWKEKVTAASFFFFPIFGEILTFYYFGISTAQVCAMLAIVLNYCVIITNREKRYAITRDGIEIASKIQVGILPRSEGAFPDRNDFDISTFMKPALTVGGDFYDFFLLDDDHMVLIIADVSDKGIPAAMFMTICKVFMKTCIQMGGSPADIIAYADRRISAENEAGMFVTLWLGIVDLSTGHVEACNAGHDYPAISILSEGYKVEKTPHGPPISFMPGMAFPEISFDLAPGESIFLYTDGLVEAKGKDDRFGTDRMLEVLNARSYESGDQLIESMRTAITEFVEDEPQFDDITMLSFTYKGR